MRGFSLFLFGGLQRPLASTLHPFFLPLQNLDAVTEVCWHDLYPSQSSTEKHACEMVLNGGKVLKITAARSHGGKVLQSGRRWNCKSNRAR